MFCIAAFIVLVVMAAFSARYRKYVGQAWKCVARRATFRTCDTTFKQDIKDRLLAPIAARSPAMVRPVSIGLEVIAILVVLTTVWSLYTVTKSGLNLYVYGTCDKQNSEACTLSAQACSIPDIDPTFAESLGAFDVIGAFGNEFGSLGETILAIPSRLRDWKAEDYLPPNATYLTPYSSDKATALEILDPGCSYCRLLFMNMKEAGFADTHNVTYIAFPISAGSEYKFANSLLVSQYLEALRLNPDASATVSLDWRLLEQIYIGENEAGVPYQRIINSSTRGETVELLEEWLSEFGLSHEQIATVASAAASTRVEKIIAANKAIVTDEIDTVKIPTLIFDGRRHDGVVSVDELSR